MNLIYTNPNNGQPTVFTGANLPTLEEGDNGKKAFGDLREYFLSLTASHPTTGVSITPRINATPSYADVMYGGEYQPSGYLQGLETYLAADITNVATEMTVEFATHTYIKGVAAQNILVANRPYLLANRKPVAGESWFDTGTENGILKPAAEIIVVDSGYSSGTTVTIARATSNLKAARKRFAVIAAIPTIFPSYGDFDKGLLIELERPDAVTMVASTCIDGGTQTIKVRWLASSQQADTANSDGDYGVVTHYGIWCVKATGAYLNNVNALPEHCPPAQYGSNSNAILALADCATTTINDVEYLELASVNEYWDPSDCALKAITAGDYWVGVKAMNQGTFDPALRMSNIDTFVKVTVA